MGENLKISESITQNLRDELAEKTQLFQNSIMEKTSEIAGFTAKFLIRMPKYPVSRNGTPACPQRFGRARMSELANFRDRRQHGY